MSKFSPATLEISKVETPEEKKTTLVATIYPPDMKDSDAKPYLNGSTPIIDDFQKISPDQGSLSLHGNLVGKETVEMGQFTYKNNEQIMVNEYELNQDINNFNTYIIYYVDENGEKVNLYATSINDNLQEGDMPDAVILDVKLRFQGITTTPTTIDGLLVRVGVGGGALQENLYQHVLFSPIGNGEWQGQAVFDIDPGSNYKILIKGPLHLQKKYCDNTPTEGSIGTYRCSEEQVVLNKGMNYLDYTGVVQLAGDVDQNGVINSIDISKIRDNIGQYDATVDLNSDGIVNAIDDALIIYTLTNRSDKN